MAWESATRRGDQKSVRIAPDGAGGAIVVWQDGRDFATNNDDIYVQRVTSGGVVLWTANGLALCNEQGLQENPALAADNAGGAFVAWSDLRPGSNSRDIFAHHVTNAGVRDPSWPTQGTGLCAATGDQELPAIVLDGASGAIAGWQDFRSGSGYGVFAQRVSGSGAPQWAADGMPAAATAGFRQDVQMVSDGTGGAILAWADFVGGDIYAQRLASDGSVASGWPANGLPVCTATGAQTNPTVVSDAANGAIIAWGDGRVGGDENVFAQRVTAAGEAGPTTGVVPHQASHSLSMSVSPTPATDFVEIRLVLDGGQAVDLRIHDLQGREVATIIERTELLPGAHRLKWALGSTGGGRIPPGLYFARALVGGVSIARPVVVMR